MNYKNSNICYTPASMLVNSSEEEMFLDNKFIFIRDGKRIFFT